LESANIYGPLVVLEGELWLDRSLGTQYDNVIDHSLVVGGNPGSPTATARVFSRRQLTDGTDAIVNKTGRLYFHGNTTNSFHGLAGAGLVDISPDAVIYIGGSAGEDHEFSGTLQGGAVGERNVHKLGLNRQTLAGPNTLLGTTEVYGGDLWVNSPQPSARFELTGAGVLGGTGSVGFVKLFPGTGLAPGAPYGTLRIADCTILGVHTSTHEFHGAGAAAAGDQIEADFQPNVANSVLKLTFAPGFQPAVGQQFTLVRNNTVSPVLGTFPNLPDGHEWRPVPALRFRINYNAGDGNDVVLTTLTPPAPAQVNRILFNPGLPTIIVGTGLPGDTYDVEATSDLANPAGWQILGTATAQAPNGAMIFPCNNTAQSTSQTPT
jgi:hypothetical protein